MNKRITTFQNIIRSIPSPTLQRQAASILLISFSLFASPVFADDAAQNDGDLGGAIGTAIGSVIKSYIHGGGNHAENPIQNVQTNADKELMANGMWHDPRTGLIWMRCSVWKDKPWDGRSTASQCAITHDVADNETMHKHHITKSIGWAENMVAASLLHFGGYSDWRLPTTLELASLTRCQYYEDGYDAPELKPVKVDLYTPDSIRVSCKKPIYSGAEISIRPDVQKLGVTGDLSANLSIRGRPIHSEYQVGFSDGGDDVSGSGFAVRGGQPDEVFTNNLIIAQKRLDDTYQKDAVNLARNKADDARFEAEKAADAAKYKRELPAYLAAYKAKTVRFRQTVQAGDHAVNGLVIQVNGNAILVQTATGDKWISRNEILPSHY